MSRRSVSLSMVWAQAVLAALLLGACGGNYGGAPQSGASSSGGGTGGVTSFSTPQAFFAAEVEPNLGFCRTCHIPGGVADTAGTGAANTQGNLFLLSGDSSQDYTRTYSAWQATGGGVANSLLLLNPSSPAQNHSGGQPWPSGSQAFTAMQTVLGCWNDPSGCAAMLSGSPTTPTTPQYPLLAEGHHGGSAFSRFCQGQPDSAALPVDPITLIQPGVNAGKAVYYNTQWKNCYPDDPSQAPHTCGEWRQRIAVGAATMDTSGSVGAATFFAGNSPGGLLTFSAADYNKLWQRWGLPGRPLNFDTLVAQRWGTPLADRRNPYPLPGEDPNQTNGGSGQLPIAVTQLRNSDGSYSGRLGLTCHTCHSGEVGIPGETAAATGQALPDVQYGASGTLDLGLMTSDLSVANPALEAITALGSTRGFQNSSQFQLVDLAAMLANPELLPQYLLTHQDIASSGVSDTPPWWNHGHRPQQFHDGFEYEDATRATTAFYAPALDGSVPTPSALEAWISAHGNNLQAWVKDQKSPRYPGPIDTTLAAQGAVLFHTKNLFAQPGNAAVQKPKGGNGSCAGCHGVYSPQYVNDPTFLDSPSLEGVAGYIVPISLIGTDSALLNAFPDPAKKVMDQTWAYNAPACGVANAPRNRIDPEWGYMAPPLYGIWASAPYFHNGSVPNVWSVLKSSDRPAVWERVSTPNQTGLNVVMGFDTSFNRAYDQQHLGWNYTVVQPPATDGLTGQSLFWTLFGNLSLSYDVVQLLKAASLEVSTTPLGQQQIADRKVYNTAQYSQSNGGHTFTDVLTDQERAAIIEYLKTL